MPPQLKALNKKLDEIFDGLNNNLESVKFDCAHPDMVVVTEGNDTYKAVIPDVVVKLK